MFFYIIIFERWRSVNGYFEWIGRRIEPKKVDGVEARVVSRPSSTFVCKKINWKLFQTGGEVCFVDGNTPWLCVLRVENRNIECERN